MTNYDDMWIIMENYTFLVDSRYSIFLTCVICKNLLIDAYESECGCTYCKVCIDKFVKEGGQSCPSGNEECIIDHVNFKNNIKKNNNANKRISQLQVKCPLNGCEFNCNLLQMNDHLTNCNRKFICCPFIEMGCDDKQVEKNKISDHLLLAFYEHSIMMIKSMDKIKNEIIDSISKISNETVKNEFNKSIKLLSDKISQISINNERDFNIYQIRYDEMSREIDLLKAKLEQVGLFNRDSIEIFDRDIQLYKDEIMLLNNEKNQINEERHQQNNEINELRVYRVKQHKEIQELRATIDLLLNDNENVSLEKKKMDISRVNCPNTSFNEINQSNFSSISVSHSKTIALFLWNINKISRIESCIDGEKIYSDGNQYVMWLIFWPRGCSFDHNDNHVCVGLKICDGISRAEMLSKRWPLKCSIIMTMKSRINENEISLKQNFIFDGPNVTRILNVPQFHFVKSDLLAKNIIIHDSTSIEFQLITE